MGDGERGWLCQLEAEAVNCYVRVERSITIGGGDKIINSSIKSHSTLAKKILLRTGIIFMYVILVKIWVRDFLTDLQTTITSLSS